jgi:hypothetical protein
MPMQVRRRRLGPSYTKSPAQLMEKWFVDNVSKIMFAVLISFLWLGILFVLIGVVRFVGAEVGEVAMMKEVTAWGAFTHPYTFPIQVIGIALVWVYVFRDSLTNR